MANLLVNGDFEASTGVSSGSSVGPGWTSDYTPCGPNSFGGGCGGGNYQFFETNAGAATNNNPTAAMIPALGARSMMVNVSGNINAAIVRWANVHLINGARYRISMDAAVVFFPFSVALRIDGVPILAVPAPPVAGQWFNTASEFTWNGTTGLHTVSLNSNTAQLAGNDHAFDNFSLERELVLPVPGCCTALMACYHDVTPCVVEPTQTTRPDATLRRFESATVAVDAPFVFRTGNSPCGGGILTPEQAAARLYDGDYGGNGNGKFIFAPGAGGTLEYPGSLITLEFDAPRDHVTSFRVFHGYGGILNDSDGMGPGSFINVFDSNNVLIAGPIAMVTANSGAGHVTPLGGPLMDVKRVTVSPVRAWVPIACVGIREMELFGGWESLLSWACGGMGLTAVIQGAQAGITVAGGMLTQTNGPHTMTFHAESGQPWDATIVTDQPGWFSTLVLDQDNPEVVIDDGGAAGSATFSVEFVFETPTRRAMVDLTTEPPTWEDAATGEILLPGSFVPVECEGAYDVRRRRNR